MLVFKLIYAMKLGEEKRDKGWNFIWPAYSFHSVQTFYFELFYKSSTAKRTNDELHKQVLFTWKCNSILANWMISFGTATSFDVYQ